MYVVQINDGKVVDILLARKDADKGTLIAIDSIPAYEPKRGYRGVLKYNTERGVYWDYEEVPEREATTEDYKEALGEMGVAVE